ncbi:MAG TPA: S8 family peptidase [Desulfobacteria bacterium]|nr:S8 family peptidase [Desulfobacteria bacterium]
MNYEVQWLNENKDRICPELQKAINQIYSIPKWMPSLLSTPVRGFKKRVRKVPVVVEIHPGHHFSNLNKANMGGVFNVEADHKLELVNGFSAEVNVDKIKELVKNKAVAKVWMDREVRAVLDIATPVVNAPSVWESSLRGKGVGIAILDTGIYPHPDLTSPVDRIKAFKDLINYRSQPYDDNGHGTHCAGDAAGNGYKSKGKYRGPAPEASLIGVKVLNRQGSGRVSTILAGIEWCIKNKKKYNIRVLSMSLGAQASVSYREDPLCRAVHKAWDAGLCVCAAAGNDGPDGKTVNSPGIDPAVITVGALDDKKTISLKDDSIAYFSSRGPTLDGRVKPDVVAPGSNIIALRAPDSYIDKYNKEARVGTWYISLSGTSMATPICSGIAALILQKRPNLKPDALKKILTSTCRTVSLDHNSQGSGLIDVQAAVRQAEASSNG